MNSIWKSSGIRGIRALLHHYYSIFAQHCQYIRQTFVKTVRFSNILSSLRPLENWENTKTASQKNPQRRFDFMRIS